MTRLTLFLLPIAGLSLWAAAPPAPKDDIPDFVKGAEGLDDALRNLKASMVTTPPLSAAEAQKRFQPRKGYVIDLIAAEPAVKQPLHIAFDHRGRMWVTQYRQYPFPAGLKVVSYDQYIRAKFDKVPPPPPHHFKGEDRITIHEDVKGDGSFSRLKAFLEDLNIATATLPDRNGVWVMNPPYLLYYPTDRDDRPGKPVVHLSGFGLEDTHAVASSLTWGPDGWIYGAQGSTCTAKVRVEVKKEKATTDFLGQAIWRYHPTKHLFEIFAEGGGNTFGVAFDSAGRLFSGTNWGTYRGLHYVQGGYYVKGWGKHGPLTNPYALGFFGHMPHQGNADRLTHTFAIYDDPLMPELSGKIIGVNSLQRRVQVTRLLPDRSTFRTEEEPFLLTTDDGRFRPVDVKAGPHGALYVADLYEPRINHVDPRDNWDRATGRIWRIRPETFTPAAPTDYNALENKQLIRLLASPSRPARESARLVLGWRKDRSTLPALRDLLRQEGQPALEALWAIHAVGGLEERTVLSALKHDSPHVRRWAIRLVGDQREASPEVAAAFARLASSERDAEVRGQLASTAKRLPASAALPILAALWTRDEDADDPHIPLLTWWALEAHAEGHRDAIVRLLSREEVRSRPIVGRFLLERIMQRWAMAGGKDNFLACARLLDASGKKSDRLLVGLEKGLVGRSTGDLPVELPRAVLGAWERGNTAGQVTLGLRLGHPPAVKKAIALIADEKATPGARLECIRIAGETSLPDSIPALLDAATKSKDSGIRQEALGSLARYSDARIGPAAMALLSEPEAVRNAALGLLASRPAWGKLLLGAVEAKKVLPQSLPFEVVHRLSQHKELADRVTKSFGKVRGGDPEKRKREMLRVASALKKGKGDAAAGKAVFKNACAKCHKLFGEGGDVGPELTGYDRTSALYWMENIIDPSAVIREEYLSFVVRLDDGRTLTGVVAGRDGTTVTLRDQEGRTTRLARSRIEEMTASPVSIMPEGQLRAMSDQQVRDLFAYLMSPRPGK
jgi:putative membrane-bound dehydrogenase-like protein